MDRVDAILELTRLKTYLRLSSEDFGIFLTDKLEALDQGIEALVKEARTEQDAIKAQQSEDASDK